MSDLSGGNIRQIGAAVSITLLFALPALAYTAKQQNEGWLWGGLGEKTTYQNPYSELMAPDIPVELQASPDEVAERKLPFSPEEAIAVIGADGCRYSYYYKKEKGLRKISEFRTVFEPCEQLVEKQVETFNPCTCQMEVQTVTVKEMTPYPVLHEKEFVRYEPADVLVRVIIVGKPDSPTADGVLTPQGAGTHLEIGNLPQGQ